MDRVDIHTDVMKSYSPVLNQGLDGTAQGTQAAAPALDQAFIAQDALPATPQEAMADVLRMFGLKPTPENLERAAALMRGGMPVTAESMRALTQALRLTGDMPQAIFMLQNTTPLNMKNAETLKGFTANETQIHDLLAQLAEAVDSLPEGPVKQKLTAILGGDIAPAAQGTENAQALNAAPAAQASQPAAVISEQAAQTTPLPETANVENPPGQQLPDKQAPAKPAQLPQPGVSPANVNQAALQSPQPAAAQTPPAGAQPTAITPEGPQQAQGEAATILREADTAEAGPRMTGELIGEALKGAKGQTVLAGGGNAANAAPADAARQSIVSPLPSPALQSEAVIGQPKALTQLLTKMMARFGFDPETDSREDVNSRLNLLRESLYEAKQTLGDEGFSRVFESVDRLERCLDFFSDLKRLVYVQVPFMLGEEARNMGLYVFRDKKQKNKGGGKQSALIALDFPFLGHFEAYIQKTGQSVSIRFKTDEEARAAVSLTVHELARRLEDAGYRLDSYAFAEKTEPFVITDGEPTVEMIGDSAELLNLDVKA